MDDPDWDVVRDVVVIGSGAAGLTGAVTAATSGHSTLIVEKASRWGGTTAFSGGGVWIPVNPLMLADGANDSVTDALHYLAATVGEVGDPGPASSAARRRAYVETGPAMVEWLSHLGFRWVRAPDYPDYHPDRPGGRTGRSIEGDLVSSRMLGDLLPTMRRVPGVVGALPIQTRDIARLVTALRTLAGAATAVRIAIRAVIARIRGDVLLAGGSTLVGQLLALAVGHGAELWLGTPFVSLVAEDGRITGVVVRRDDRELRVQARRGVLLAAGGFARADAYRRRHQPVGADWTAAPRGDDGDAIRAGVEVGAATALMDAAWWGPTFVTPDGGRIFSVWERSMPHALIVDGDGRRYCNESAPYVDVGRAMLDHDQHAPAVPSWLVMDARHRRRYPLGTLPPGITPRRLIGDDFLVRADTLPALGTAMGVDASTLAATVARFNRWCATGVDEDHGRGSTAYERFFGDPTVGPNPNLGAVERAPYWAVRLYPGDLGTKGGLLTDEHGRVVTEEGRPIPGLYAAGNCSASVMGRAYPGPGATIGPAMVFGHLAARHATATPQ